MAEVTNKKGLLERFVANIKGFVKPEYESKEKGSKAEFYPTFQSTYRPLFSISFNGEKNFGDLGPVINYRLDYQGLRYRSWQAQLESEIAQTVVNRYCTWVIGKGLKLQCEPPKSILESEGINWDNKASQKFCDITETRFTTWRKSKYSSYDRMSNFDLKCYEAYKNAIVGGDVLVVLRYENNMVNVQLIDGQHVRSPEYGTEWFPQLLQNGNRIIDGVEVNERDEHVAYHVRSWDPYKQYQFERIPAKTKGSDLQVAFLVYGLKHRINNVRGIPLLSAVLETLKKLERYKEAMVGNAEEIAKIVYQIVHKEFSTGENPLMQNLAAASGFAPDIPVTDDGQVLADKVASTTNKNTYNMPVGSELKPLESKGNLYFKEFYETNINLICAALGIPPEVAMSKYDSNFSASRAALKDWENTLLVRRNEFMFQMMRPTYAFWLETEILKNKIIAPGYVLASVQKNEILLEAYRSARFVGTPVPHIDPLKEVNAERTKLGMLGANMPLTTVEAATEALNSGDSNSNMEQFAKEMEMASKLGIELEDPEPAKEKKKEED